MINLLTCGCEETLHLPQGAKQHQKHTYCDVNLLPSDTYRVAVAQVVEQVA